MQIKNLPKKKIRIFITYFLGPLLFIWLSWSIYTQIKKQPDLEGSWTHIRQSLQGPLIWNLIGVIFLMGINWAIETVKWQLCIRKIQKISFLTAFKAVLS